MARKLGKTVCLNPVCSKPFTPGHYGKKQVVGKGDDHVHQISCPTCKGTGKKQGKECWRCQGKKIVDQTCTEWYRGYWAQIRKPPRGIPPLVFSKIEKAARPEQLHHACVIAARESGMRKGELLGIKWGDIIDAAGKVKKCFNIHGQWDDVEGFKPTKTRAGRPGYFLPKAVLIIAKLTKGAADDRVFPFFESRIYTWFIDLQKSLGITNPETGSPYRWHDLRHSLGTELVHGHGDKGLTLAAQILGHKSLNTTRGYSQLSDDEFMDQVGELRRG